MTYMTDDDHKAYIEAQGIQEELHQIIDLLSNAVSRTVIRPSGLFGAADPASQGKRHNLKLIQAAAVQVNQLKEQFINDHNLSEISRAYMPQESVAVLNS